MADYKEAYDFSYNDSPIADEARERRITANSTTSGIFIQGPIGPKVKHRATFESAGEHFKVVELKAALNKLNASADATITFDICDGEGVVNGTTIATVEWVA